MMTAYVKETFMDHMEYLSLRLQCSYEDKLECLETVKKLYSLAALARKEGLLALEDAVKNEDLFLKTMVDALIDSFETKPLETIFSAYLAAGNYRGKEFLKNLLIVNGLILIAKNKVPHQVVNELQGWFGVEFAQTYKNELAAEIARLKPPPAPKEKSTVPEFDRLADFSKVYTIKLLSEIENRTLSIALNGASDKVADHLFHLMENSRAEEVRMDLENLQYLRIIDVEEAQRDILEKAGELEEEENRDDA